MKVNKPNYFFISALVFTGIFIVSIFSASGQSKMSPERQKLSNIKISLISSRLNLTPEQSIRFWPVYQEYSAKRRKIHKSIRQIINYKKSPVISDVKSVADINRVQQLKQNELDLDKQYQYHLLKIISGRQLNELYLTEDAYRKMLLERLKR